MRSVGAFLCMGAARSARPALLVWALLLALPVVASAEPHSDFQDTRLTITLGDDDLLTDAADSGGTMRVGFGNRAGYELFFDNLDSKDTGRETATHLVLHRKMPAFFEHLTAEAALVARLDINNWAGVTLRDTGSYIRLHYHPWDDEEQGLTLVAYPLDADHLCLGYLYRMSVGGADFYPRSGWLGAPGFKLQLTVGHGYYYAGFKTLPGFDSTKGSGVSQSMVIETQYTALAGAGWDLAGDRLLLELEGGYFEQGANQTEAVLGEKVFSFGGAFRAVYHQGMEVGQSIDLTLYTNDLNRPLRAFAPVRYRPGEVGFLVSVEGVVLGQNLADPALSGETTIQPAMAFALQGRLAAGYLRLEVTAMVKDVPFMVRNAIGFPTYQALPDEAETAPMVMGAATVDYHIPGAHLTLALSGGVMRPASIKTKLWATTSGSGAPPTLIGTHVMVLGEGAGSRIILPDGEEAGLVVHSRVQARLDIAEMLYTLLWVQLIHDPNRTRLQINADLTKSRVSVDSLRPGVGITAAVRF